MSEEPSDLPPAATPQRIISLIPDAVPESPTTTAVGSSGTSTPDEPPRLSRRARRAAEMQAREERNVRLSKDELRERLRINSNGLIEEIHAIALRQNQLEDQREARLDGKATSLIAAAGLSVAVTFTFGSMLAPNSTFFTPLGTGGVIVPALYALALFCGFLATLLAVIAHKIRDYKSLSDEDVFNVHEIERIERVARDKDGQIDEKKAQAEYRRYITLQHWTFHRVHSDIHDKKADVIKWGQRFFLAFVCTLFLIGSVIAGTAFVRFSKTEPPTTSSTVNP